MEQNKIRRKSMKKFMVALVLLIGCTLLGQESTDKVLEKIPDEYVGKYYMYGMIEGGKNNVKNGQHIGTVIDNTFVVAFNDEVIHISRIVSTTFQGKSVLFVEFEGKDDAISLTTAEGGSYYLCVYAKDSEKCTYILVIKIKKDKEV
jgi:hypothetical protein